eukprot:SAG11_NODE_1393_length_5047_cov_14.071140_2_plen_77_part_00
MVRPYPGTVVPKLRHQIELEQRAFQNRSQKFLKFSDEVFRSYAPENRVLFPLVLPKDPSSRLPGKISGSLHVYMSK